MDVSKFAIRAGWRPAEFARAIGISRSGLYALPPELQPHSVKLGDSRVIKEPPEAYLDRIAAMQSKAAA